MSGERTIDLIPEEKQAVVIESVRTPTGKSGWAGMEKGGQFAYIPAQALIGSAIEGLLEKVKERCPDFKTEEIEDCAIGCLSQIGEQGLNLGRRSVISSDLPQEISGWTVNRYCNAGLQAINSQAQAIMTGCGDIMLAGGVELMSHYGMGSDMQVVREADFPMFTNTKRAERIAPMAIPMGLAAENMAEEFDYDQEEMHKFGLWSNQKAVEEMDNEEEYKKRVVPVTTRQKVEEEEGEYEEKKWEIDEPPRREAVEDPESELEAMKNLPTPFKDDGVITAGNSSGIVDGGAAALLMSAEKAEQLGLDPIVRIVSMATAGDEPFFFQLLATKPATEKALERAGLGIDDMDVLEVNEAFATENFYHADEMGYDRFDERVNPTGGAIAIGHPIGASGVLYFTEMIHYMQREKLDYGLFTLCGGGGIGIATVVERI